MPIKKSLKIVRPAALFIGRFQPFHLGHLDAIFQILNKNERIIIGIGSAQYKGQPKNPFAAALRRHMIGRSLIAAGIPKKCFTLVEIPDIHDDSRWVAYVEKTVPRFCEIWSGTKKVQELFKKNGKYKVRRPKMNLKISGTEVRRRIAAEEKWEVLVPKTVEKLLINKLRNY